MRLRKQNCFHMVNLMVLTDMTELMSQLYRLVSNENLKCWSYLSETIAISTGINLIMDFNTAPNFHF